MRWQKYFTKSTTGFIKLRQIIMVVRLQLTTLVMDLQKVLKERLGVEVHERTVGKYLTALGYHRLSVRPQHPDADPEAQEAFKKTSAKSWRKPSRQGLRTSPSKSGFKTKPASASKAP